ncbi:MAG: DUF3892 domain-containing protein [Rhodoferax sp.]|uniref:DUF3892 domain-containing protein n=1 Tax=Rhodoferax sp. TaxID=50421 RepID=UPI002ACEEDE4|nr:DUF3892 domain-containing protein [Rhodoferax sp.]MDZ7891508.1 DUF3892 domain-containing protein [Rhodoferax sp.]
MTVHLQCVAKRMRRGYKHEHLEILWWVQVVDGKPTHETGFSTHSQLLEYVASSGPQALWCPAAQKGQTGAWVGVQTLGSKKYLQAFRDGRPTDDLLALPDR